MDLTFYDRVVAKFHSGVEKTVLIVHFNETETEEKLIFQQLSNLYPS